MFCGACVLYDRDLLIDSDNEIALGVTAARMNEIELHICNTALVFALGDKDLAAHELASAEAAFAGMASCGHFYACTLKCAEHGFAAACFDDRLVSTVDDRDAEILLFIGFFA